MSWLSKGLKKLESNVGGLYDKNLRSLVEEYKRPALGLAAGAGLSLIPGVGLMAPMLAGGALGYQRTEKRKEEEKAARKLEAELASRDAAGEELDRYLDDIRQQPGEPTPTQPPPPPGSEYLAPPGGGIVGGTTGAGYDEQKLLNEAELKRQEMLKQYEQNQALRQQYLGELSGLLTQQSERQFQESLPGMYEDLNTRGLLRSSALGDRMSTEQAKLAQQVQEQLAMQSLQDRGMALNELTGAQGQYFDDRGGAIQRRFSLEDYARQIDASKLLGQTMAPVSQYSGGKNSAQNASLAMQAGGLGIQGKAALQPIPKVPQG